MLWLWLPGADRTIGSTGIPLPSPLSPGEGAGGDGRYKPFMNWKLILLLSTQGILLGGLSVLGVAVDWGVALWPALGVLTALTVAMKGRRLPFASGFLIGLLAVVSAQAVVIVFFDSYLSHHPKSAAEFSSDQWRSIDPRLFVAIVAAPMGLVWGAILGVASLALHKLMDSF